MDDWRIAVELAFRLGADFDLATVDEVTDEIARVAPAHRRCRPLRCCAVRATVSCCRCATTVDEIVVPHARRCRSSPRTARERRGTRSRSRARSRDSEVIESTKAATRSRGARSAAEVDRSRRTAASRGADLWVPGRRRRPTGPSVPARDAYALRLVVGPARSTTTGGIVSETPDASAARAPTVAVARQSARRLRARCRGRHRGEGHVGPRPAGASRRRRPGGTRRASR